LLLHKSRDPLFNGGVCSQSSGVRSNVVETLTPHARRSRVRLPMKWIF
jgi:hypothetical protein